MRRASMGTADSAKPIVPNAAPAYRRPENAGSRGRSASVAPASLRARPASMKLAHHSTAARSLTEPRV